MRLVTIAILVLAAALPAAGDDRSELEKAVADGLIEFAVWCEKEELDAEAGELAGEALALVPDHAAAKTLQARLGGERAASEAARRAYDRRREALRKKLGPAYLRLFSIAHPPADQARHDGYLLKAYACDTKKVGRAVETEWRSALSDGDSARAHRLLTGAEAIQSDPARAKALLAVERKLAETTPVLKKATIHEMEYYLVLPRGWNAERTWPILVTVEGAGCNWLGNCRGFLGARGDSPFILVTPLGFWNTNDLDAKKYNYPAELLDRYRSGNRREFDEAGLLAILEDVRRDFGGRDKIFITGFSGGGNLTWRMVFGHPEKVAAAAPACANFYDPGPISDHGDREYLPVLAFQGDKDAHLDMLNGQWDRAKALCDGRGYGNVDRKMLPGVGHSACMGEVMKFFRDHLRE